MAAALRRNRLARELDMLCKDPPPGITARVVPGTARREGEAEAEADGSREGGKEQAAANGEQDVNLTVTVLGPAGTPFEGGRFVLDVRLTPQYPFDAPGIRFVTRVFHPNVDESGRICLDSLKLPPAGSWRPSLNLTQVLSQIQILLGEPGLGDPLRPEVAEMFQSDREQYDRTAREWTARYASSGATATAATTPMGDVKRARSET